MSNTGKASATRPVGIRVVGNGCDQPPQDYLLTNPIVPQQADPHVVLHDDGYY